MSETKWFALSYKVLGTQAQVCSPRLACGSSSMHAFIACAPLLGTFGARSFTLSVRASPSLLSYVEY